MKISIISARSGNTTFFAYETYREKRAPSTFALTINQGGKDVVYCENITKRNESGSTISVHFNNGAIAFELKSVCENKNCTGVVCEPCYNSPPVVKISVKEPVVMYDNVTLTCHITSLTDDTKIVWFVQNETLLRAINNNDKYKVTTSKSQQLSNLTITSVRHEDEMNYTCKATNFIQTGKSYPMHLSVFENPIVNVSKTITAKAGTNTTMWCEVSTSSKAIGISWIKNGRIIQITNSTKYGGGTISSPSLEISNVQQAEEGNYTCLATNPIGTGNQTVFLAIVLDPIANISSESVILGNNITVSCYVHLSTKETNITWLKNDKIIQIKGSEKYDVGTFSYEIYHVQLEDEGHYTCQASSPIGIVTSQPVSLSVITFPIANISDIAPAKAGTNITISCYVPSSSKATNITWLKDGVIINITRNRKYGGGTVSSPSLQIYHLRLADEGNYTCQATNIIDIGRSQPVFLTVNLDVTKETSSLHTSGAHIFSSYPLYSTETFESSKTTYLSSYESPKRTLTSTKILQSISKIPVPTASVKHIEPTYFVQTSATTLYNIHPSSTSLTLQANSDNRTNVNAWIITTVIICIVEAIVITLVVYIRWLKRKQNIKDEMHRKIRDQQQEMMDNLTIGTQSVILGNGTYRGTPSFIMDNGTLRTQRSILPLYATMGRHHSTLMETDNPMSEDYLYSEINKVPSDNHPDIPNGGQRIETSHVIEHPASEDYHYTEINKVRRYNNPVVANGEIHSNHTDMSNESPISDGKQQQRNDKLCKDESPAIPNRMLPEEPSDDALNETEVTSL
ncbi:neural cell adhesion molecule 1-like isoform X2 [Mytilus edulis]|uniref:neural cell adhesion molecule 1-like isoform X2 n=1 Tax=Mytilus edulis TaxID=6550 RepID=UPI0039EE5025